MTPGKTAIIGNSHLKALAGALATASNRPRVEPDFYPIAGQWALTQSGLLEMSRPRLFRLPRTDDDPGIDVGDYSQVVIGACGLWAARNQFVAGDDRRSHPLGLIARADWAPAQHPAAASLQLVSAAVFTATVESWVRQHSMSRLALAVAEHFDGPIILMPWPAPSRALKSDPTWFMNQWYGAFGPQAWFDYFTAQNAGVQKVAQALGPRCRVLEHPVEESRLDGFLDANLCGADPWHGNRAYGALVIDRLEWE